MINVTRINNGILWLKKNKSGFFTDKDYVNKPACKYGETRYKCTDYIDIVVTSKDDFKDLNHREDIARIILQKYFPNDYKHNEQIHFRCDYSNWLHHSCVDNFLKGFTNELNIGFWIIPGKPDEEITEGDLKVRKKEDDQAARTRLIKLFAKDNMDAILNKYGIRWFNQKLVLDPSRFNEVMQEYLQNTLIKELNEIGVHVKLNECIFGSYSKFHEVIVASKRNIVFDNIDNVKADEGECNGIS